MSKGHSITIKSGLLCSLLALLIGLPSNGVADAPGQLAARETRNLAQDFPGRMGGTEQEQAAADYLLQRFQEFGYEPVADEFSVSYQFFMADEGKARTRQGTSRNVIAEIAGSGDELIIIGAHYDTAVARSKELAQKGVGGPALEGVDDNASGVGVLLELAKGLVDTKPTHTIRFIAFGAEEVGLQGARRVVNQLSPAERDSLLLMINIDSIVTGDHLYVHAGPSTLDSHPHAAESRDQAVRVAAEFGFELRKNPGLHADYPAGTGCCSDQAAFDSAGLPVINIEATNWRLGDRDGYQQTAISEAFPEGESWHRASLDQLAHLEAHLPATRIQERSAQVVKVLMALLQWQAGRDD